MGRALSDWVSTLQGLESGAALDPENVDALRTDLAACAEKHAALQHEFDELNHMLTHQPPSAWAKREKKYHDDKKAWDRSETMYKDKLKRLQDEVRALKGNDVAVALEEKLQAETAAKSEAQSRASAAEAALAKSTREEASLKDELSKLEAQRREAVQDSVQARMAMTKMETELQSKMAEAASEKQKAAEARRLLEKLKSDFNETTLKGDGLKEQLEGMRTASAALTSKHDQEVAELNVLLTQARAAAEEASHAKLKAEREAAEAVEKAKVLEMTADAAAGTAADIAALRAQAEAASEAHVAELTTARTAAAEANLRADELGQQVADLRRRLAAQEMELTAKEDELAHATQAAEAAAAANGRAAESTAEVVVDNAQQDADAQGKGIDAAEPRGVGRDADEEPDAVAQANVVVDKARRVMSFEQEIQAWQSRAGAPPLPTADVAILKASGHEVLVRDLMTSLISQSAAARRDELTTCAEALESCPWGDLADSADADLNHSQRVALAQAAVLRAAAEAGHSAKASAAEDNGALAAAFASALRGEDAAKDRELVALVNALKVAESYAHDGRPLTKESIKVLREAAQRSASEDAKRRWQALDDDAAFLTAFASACVGQSTTAQGAEVEGITVPEEQRILFQTVAAAVVAPGANASTSSRTYPSERPWTRAAPPSAAPSSAGREPAREGSAHVMGSVNEGPRQGSLTFAQEIQGWQSRAGVAPMPDAAAAALTASGHEPLVRDILSNLDAQTAAATRSRLQACAASLEANASSGSGDASPSAAKGAYAQRVGTAQAAVLRAAARGDAAEALSTPADDVDQFTATIAAALRAEDAPQNQPLTAVVNALKLAEGVAHDGQPLTSASMDLLREAALRSSSAQALQRWKSLGGGADFLTAFASACVGQPTTADGALDDLPVPQEQRIIFQTVAAAILAPGVNGPGSSAPNATPTPAATDRAAATSPTSGSTAAGALANGAADADGTGTDATLLGASSGGGPAAIRVPALSGVDLSELPNTPHSRALREYAASCEVSIEVQRNQVSRMLQQLDEKDRALAILEAKIFELLQSQPEQSRGWLGAFGAQSQNSARSRSLETRLKLAEQKTSFILKRAKEAGVNLEGSEVSLEDGGSVDVDASPLKATASSGARENDAMLARQMAKENEYLTEVVVKLKVDVAEIHGELMSNKRALARALEREQRMREELGSYEFSGSLASPRTVATDAANDKLETPRSNERTPRGGANATVASTPRSEA